MQDSSFRAAPVIPTEPVSSPCSRSDQRIIAASRALYDIDHAGWSPSWMVKEDHPERFMWGKEAARIIAVIDAIAAVEPDTTTASQAPSGYEAEGEVSKKTGTRHD